jgi:hypothetical protein
MKLKDTCRRGAFLGLAGVIVLSLIAAAHGPTQAASRLGPTEILSTSVSTPEYDRQGRLASTRVDSYDCGGQFLGRTLHEYRYREDGQLVYSKSASFGADGRKSGWSETEWQLAVRGHMREGTTRYFDGTDELLRVENETWTDDPEARTLTVETLEFDAVRTFTGSRYLISERDAKGRTIGWDFSSYDAQGTQLSRAYSTWRYDALDRLHGIHKYLFDAADELTAREEETRTYVGDSRRLHGIQTTRTDAEGNPTGYEDEWYAYDERERQTGRTLVLFDARESPLRQLVESTTYDAAGRLLSRRAAWEVFAR